MKKYQFLAGLCLLLIFTACTKNPKLKIEGIISNSEGKMLYFEHSDIKNDEVLDSAKLDKEGHFQFKTALSGTPEFYKLRIGKQFIQLAADSTASIVIQADGKNPGSNYSVEGSNTCKQIQALAYSQAKTQASLDSLITLLSNKQLTDSTFKTQAEHRIGLHRDFAKNIILNNPRSPESYYALFQNIHNYPVFDPYNKADNILFSAAATSWSTFYPNSDRGKNLITLTLQGIKTIRQEESAQNIVLHEQDKLSYFEIKLPNVYNKEIALSSLKGKVVLLDFTAYQTKFSPNRTLLLRKLHATFASKGFEIYQISLDTDENFWKTSAANLPWTCVHDINGNRSKYLKTFNVEGIPTFFLLNRKGEIVKRDATISDLNKEITNLL